MKYLLALALVSSVAFATEHEAKKEEHAAEVKTEKVVEKTETKKDDKKAAYKKAKDECLKENKELKGKELTACIVSKNK